MFYKYPKMQMNQALRLTNLTDHTRILVSLKQDLKVISKRDFNSRVLTIQKSFI